ncbi:MAG: hypothetical protein Q9165_000111 [Trypethelium subeluteriae]
MSSSPSSSSPSHFLEGTNTDTHTHFIDFYSTTATTTTTTTTTSSDFPTDGTPFPFFALPPPLRTRILSHFNHFPASNRTARALLLASRRTHVEYLSQLVQDAHFTVSSLHAAADVEPLRQYLGRVQWVWPGRVPHRVTVWPTGEMRALYFPRWGAMGGGGGGGGGDEGEIAWGVRSVLGSWVGRMLPRELKTEVEVRIVTGRVRQSPTYDLSLRVAKGRETEGGEWVEMGEMKRRYVRVLCTPVEKVWWKQWLQKVVCGHNDRGS